VLCRHRILFSVLLALTQPYVCQAEIFGSARAGCLWVLQKVRLAPPPPSAAVTLHLTDAAQDPHRLNVYNVKELADAAGKLADLIRSRDELVPLRPRMEAAAQSSSLTYREFLTIFMESGRLLTKGEAREFKNTNLQVDTLLNAGVVILPVIQDVPMERLELMTYRSAFVYPYQLVSKPQMADGSIKSPWDFLYHDHLHSSLMFAKDNYDGLLKHKNALRDPAAKQRWLAQRAATYESLWRGLDKLKAREQTVVTDVLFELLHEWPPERENPAQNALRDLNKLGLAPTAEVRRGLREHKRAAAQYLQRRLHDPNAAEIEKALTWIADTL